MYLYICRYKQTTIERVTMAPQNSTLINLINDDIKSITSERLSPIPQANFPSTSDDDDDDEV